MRVLLLVVMMHAGVTHAETRTESYRTSMAIADGLSIATLGTGVGLLVSTDGGAGRVVGIIATVVGGGGFIWASPIIHNAHGRDEVSKVDIGARIIVPGLAAGIAAGNKSSTATTIAAGALGAVAVSVVDIAFFGKRNVPYVAVTDAAASLGIAGRF